MDICTAKPADKLEISRIVDGADGCYVDVAAMGSFPALKHKVPLLISGRGVEIMQKEYVAKSLEEALAAASAEFGVPEEQLKYQKISENGILFAKKVKILVTVPEKKEEPVAEPVTTAPDLPKV